MNIKSYNVNLWKVANAEAVLHESPKRQSNNPINLYVEETAQVPVGCCAIPFLSFQNAFSGSNALTTGEFRWDRRLRRSQAKQQ